MRFKVLLLLMDIFRIGLYMGRQYYWSPYNNMWLLIPKKVKTKKTYLKRIEEILSDFPMDYNTMIDIMKFNWNENKTFREGYVKMALRKGINQNIIVQVKVEGEKK